MQVKDKLKENTESFIENPSFCAFMVMLMPPLGIIFGIHLLKTKRLPKNREYGYQAIKHGILGSLLLLIFGIYLAVNINRMTKDDWQGISVVCPAAYFFYAAWVYKMLAYRVSREGKQFRKNYPEFFGEESKARLKKISKKKEGKIEEQEIPMETICLNPECGFKNEEGSRFCEQCGAQLKE